MDTMTHSRECSAPTGPMLLAFELGQRWWKLGFTISGGRVRTCRVSAGDVEAVAREIARAQARYRSAAETPVMSCYEAGQDGFWLHRYLVAHGVTNHVVDSSSIEVNRRARRTKTDRLDLGGLLSLLARYVSGDHRVWRVVRVPSVAEEDARQLHRTLATLQQDRTRLRNRLQAVLTTHGVRVGITGDFLKRVEAARLWDGTTIPAGAQQRLAHEWRQLQTVEQLLREGQAARAALVADLHTATGRAVAQLQRLRAIGPTGAWTLATEIFGWRQIRNARQLGALVGLVPAVYQSGELHRDQGITRAGNTHVRRVLVQLAWQWIRYQPASALTQWYQRRFGGGGKRLRRIGIVALARKLLVTLWRFVDSHALPEGAVLKPLAG